MVQAMCLVLEMSVVRGVRGVGGVCERCMCLARGGVGFGIYQYCRNRGSVGHVSVLRWSDWCWKEWVGRLVPGLGGWVPWCYVCVGCESELFV